MQIVLTETLMKNRNITTHAMSRQHQLCNVNVTGCGDRRFRSRISSLVDISIATAGISLMLDT